MTANLVPADEGSDWLYWEPKPRKWRHVELLEVPGEGAKRVRVQHLDAEMKGKAEWAPAGRLRAPWADREAHLAELERWRRLTEDAPRDGVADVAALVLYRYVPDTVADFETSGGVLRIHDTNALEEVAGLSLAELEAIAHSARDGNDVLISWTGAEAVVRALCRRDSRPAMQMYDEWRGLERQTDRREMSDGRPWWESDELEDDERAWAERARWHHGRALAQMQRLRTWIGGTEAALVDNYVELQAMYEELVRATEEAILRLRGDRTLISGRIADRLETMAKRRLPVGGVHGVPSGDLPRP